MITPAFGLTATERVLPKLALDFTTALLDSRITFTRTTGASNPATYTNSSGYIANSTNDAPRFDYDPIALTCKGLLIEESRTNLCYPSDTFGSPWTQNGSFIDTNATTAPTNTSVGSKLREATTTGGHITSFPYTKAIGVPISFSVYAKADQRTRIRVTIDAGFGDVTFDLSNGTIAAGSNGTITNVGNGWYRCSISKTTQWGSATACTISLVSTGTTVSYTGIANYGAFIWGAQFEDGAFVTSYIPTTTATLTRNADVAVMTGANFSSWFNATEGSAVIQAIPSTVSGTRPAVDFDDNTANETIVLRGVAADPQLYIVDGGAAQATLDAGTISVNTVYRLGGAWKSSSFATSVNGGAAVSQLSGTYPTVTQARLGSDGTNYLNGWLQNFRYWPQRITSAETQAFSK